MLRIAAILVASLLAVSAAGEVAAEAPPETPEERIDRLIDELGNDDYFARQRAQTQLAELGFDAYDALLAATTDDDLEIATRAKYLLRLISAEWSAENEPEEVRQWLTYYQSPSQTAEVRIQVLQVLAHLPRGVGVPALCRLVRFERETQWSKRAAVVILNGEPADRAGRSRWARAVRDALGRSGRPAARWLRTYLDFRTDPKAALAQWTKAVEAERAVLERSPNQSSPRVVATLLYYLAMARAAHGDEALAEKTAQQARQVSPDRSAPRLDARIDTATALQRRGMFQWAEREFRSVIDAESQEWSVRGELALSEMLHDKGENLRAAEILKQALELPEQELSVILEKLKPTTGFDRSVGGVRARMEYFHACHWLTQGDPAKHRKSLEEAIKHDPEELDTLIALYGLPDQEPEDREKTVQLIEKAAAALRDKVRRDPDKPRHYNEFAWLVGNTQGDQDEALRYSQKAVDLRPESGIYLDTLAHVYFGRGDLDRAVTHQARAAELEPHSGLIVRKLEVFRKALDDEKKNAKQEQKGTAQPESRSTDHEDAESQRD